MGTILKNGISYSGSGSGSGGASSYTELTDKPSINGVTLSGNKTTSDLGIVSDGYAPSDAAETSLADGDYFPFQDVSANGKRKTLWSNIKSVLKTYFDTLYQKTLTAGTNITISNNTISAMATVDGMFKKSDLYSTSEKVIGCWTDGRPLYQITKTFSLANSATMQSFSHGISNISTVVDYHAMIVDSTNFYWVVNECGNFIDGSLNADFSIMDRTTVYFQWKKTGNSASLVCTFRYTKTTDSANSFNYADVNDYSTSEKIVGTWINGENLYQRTFTGTTTSNAVLTQVGTITSSWYIRSFEGSLVQGSGIYVPISYTNGVDPNNLTTLGKDSVFPYTENGKLYMLVGEYNQGKSYCLTIKYTK